MLQPIRSATAATGSVIAPQSAPFFAPAPFDEPPRLTSTRRTVLATAAGAIGSRPSCATWNGFRRDRDHAPGHGFGGLGPEAHALIDRDWQLRLSRSECRCLRDRDEGKSRYFGPFALPAPLTYR